MEKVFIKYCVVNWRSGKTKVLTSVPKKIGNTDVVVLLNMKIVVPEMGIHSVDVNIKVPEAKINGVLVDEL